MLSDFFFFFVFFGLQVIAVFSMTAELMVYPHDPVDFVDEAGSAKLKLYNPLTRLHLRTVNS